MRRAAAYSLMLVLLAAGAASACPVCVGDKDSPMTAGMNTAILVMLGIVGGVLSGFIAFFIFMWRRLRRQRESLSNEAWITDDGTLRLSRHNGSHKGRVEWKNT